jgi:hypothetical protein
MNRSLLAVALAGALPLAAQAQESTETQQIREEMQQLREQYEQRIKALEQRLDAAEKKPAATPDRAAPAVADTGPKDPVARKGAPRNFNPNISLILQGTYADFSSDDEPLMPGFLLGPETELRPDGFALAETELAIEANVDDKFRGWATIALENEDGETKVELEEAYLNTLALPHGLGVKFGRFFSDFGYLNRVHSHAWDFADQPLVYRAFFANQLKDDGMQLRWVAPTDLFVELGAEALRGAGFPAGGEDRSGVNTTVAFARIGGDLSDSSAYRLGLSRINADADERAVEDEETGVSTVFTGDSNTTGIDFVYKWAPKGNPAVNNFIFQAEYYVRDEDGDVVFNPEGGDFDGDGVADPTFASAYDGRQKGFYLQGAYQFMPRWRAGLRYDRLKANNDVPGAPALDTALDNLADTGTDPERWSAMLDWSGSEFSRIRLQYNRDESRPGGEKDDQWLLQYIYSLGAHPAHQF